MISIAKGLPRVRVRGGFCVFTSPLMDIAGKEMSDSKTKNSLVISRESMTTTIGTS